MLAYTYKEGTLSLIKILGIVCIMVVGFSCSKPTITRENFEASNLRVIQCLPGKTSVQFFLDTFRITNTTLLNYRNITQYFVVKSGNRKASFYSTTTKDTFATTNIVLESKKIYSLFLAGNATTPKYFFTEDNHTQPSLDKAKIRLANLSSNTGDLYMTAQTAIAPETKILDNVSQESVSDYVLFNVPTSTANNKVTPVTFRIYRVGIPGAIAVVSNVDTRGSLIYSIVLAGTIGGNPAIQTTFIREWLDY